MAGSKAKWFDGKVTTYDDDSGLYEIVYEDGDSEEVVIDVLRTILVGVTRKKNRHSTIDVIKTQPALSSSTTTTTASADNKLSKATVHLPKASSKNGIGSSTRKKSSERETRSRNEAVDSSTSTILKKRPRLSKGIANEGKQSDEVNKKRTPSTENICNTSHTAAEETLVKEGTRPTQAKRAANKSSKTTSTAGNQKPSEVQNASKETTIESAEPLVRRKRPLRVAAIAAAAEITESSARLKRPLKQDTRRPSTKAATTIDRTPPTTTKKSSQSADQVVATGSKVRRVRMLFLLHY